MKDKDLNLQGKKIGLKRCYQNIFFMLRLVIKYTPSYFVNICLFEIYSAVQVFFEFTYTMKVLLDMITNGSDYMTAVVYLLVMLAMVMIKLLWAAWTENVITPKSTEILHKQLRMMLYEKSTKLDLECYDNPKYYNEFVWSINEAANRMDLILQDFKRFLSQMARAFSAGLFTLTLDAFGLVFVLLSLIITLFANSYRGRNTFSMDAELKPIERKRSYFNRIFYLNDYAKEIRLNQVSKQLKNLFSETNKQVYPVVKKYGAKAALASVVEQIIANDILFNTLYLGYLVYRTVSMKALTYGGTMALFGAASSLKNSLNYIAELFPKFEQHGLYVEKIRTFLAFESNMEDGTDKINNEFKGLEIRNVTFAYGNSPNTLNDVSFSIKPGEKIAIVGYNGAGKTTLIKLLLRLYDTNQGEILYNGLNIKKYNKKEYRSKYATVFQDYKIFASTIADNVAMDNTDEKNEDSITKALSQAGFDEKLSSLDEGIYTQLTREFAEAGVNLSGGEAQKVAIARTFYKYCPIIILDEPSSALDPVSEYQLNHAMFEAAKDKSVIFISHRLSSTVMADHIYMFEKGRIIEQGNHAELMKRDGKYAQMFKMQAEKYNIFK